MIRIVLLGAPGSGKGTQAQRLQAKHGIPQVSSGDLLRDAVARGTELGRKAKTVMEAGQLVSDEIVLGLIRDRLSRADAAAGFILDGFPRNIEQANALDELLREIGQPLDAVLLLDVRRETLMQRLAGRRICPKCGTVYNVHSLPSGATTCARDGAELYQRPDDKEEVIGRRLEVYEQQTRPLVEHYSQLGLLRIVAGEGELDEVFERMEAAALAQPVPAAQVKLTRGRTRAAAKSASTGLPARRRSKTGTRQARSAGAKTAGLAPRSTARGSTAPAKTLSSKTSRSKTSGSKTSGSKTSGSRSSGSRASRSRVSASSTRGSTSRVAAVRGSASRASKSGTSPLQRRAGGSAAGRGSPSKSTARRAPVRSARAVASKSVRTRARAGSGAGAQRVLSRGSKRGVGRAVVTGRAGGQAASRRRAATSGQGGRSTRKTSTRKASTRKALVRRAGASARKRSAR